MRLLGKEASPRIARQWLIHPGVAHDGRSESVSYTNFGKVGSTTDRDGVTRTYGCDAQFGWLTAVTDHEGNRISYGYDSMGNRTCEERFDSAGTRSFYRGWDFGYPQIPGKLWKEIGADGTSSALSYDSATGLLSSRTGADGRAMSYDYDALARVHTITQPQDALTIFGLNSRDRVVSATDAAGFETTYAVDDLGRTVQENSPARGLIRYAWNEAGNLTGKMDAAGVSTAYAYDLLGRLTGVSYPDSWENVSFTYDEGANGKGRRTGMVDPSGRTSYVYDSSGKPLGVETTISGQGFADVLDSF